MDAKISKWANNVLPTVATVGIAAVALVTVVIVSAHVGISDELRARLIAGTSLALLLLFATGPMRYTATGDALSAQETPGRRADHRSASKSRALSQVLTIGIYTNDDSDRDRHSFAPSLAA